MNRPVHFEIPAEKPERAIQFYKKVFGWKFERWNGPMENWTIGQAIASQRSTAV